MSSHTIELTDTLHDYLLRIGTRESSVARELRAHTFDFAFIDADKANYDAYYERCLTLLRRGGVIGIDNVLWGGRVVDDRVQDDDTRAIRALNAKVNADDRVDATMLPIGDGLTLAVKR